ncbi:hypothetical protein HGRIS_012872 [Hohenbuehelia grisea]|uniref:Uncharacterized protein n=1 Tax=Hohenbuehelia grisea TaxID=104357 RepID=A0ABR3ITL3_9AGAR
MDLPPFASTSRSRLQSLYSAFDPQKHSNPSSYHANVDWWRRALHALTRSTGSLTFTADAALLQTLRIPGVGKPLSLGTVITDLQQTHALIPRSTFLTSPRSIYHSSSLPVRIASAVVGRPLWWALEHLGVVGEEGFLYSTAVKGTQWYGDYVVLDLVEQAADNVQSMQAKIESGSAADRLYTREAFRKAFAAALRQTTSGGGEEQAMSEDDADVILRYLERDRGVLVLDKNVIKFLSTQDAPADERTVTAVDRGILELKTAVDSMHRQIEAIQLKIDECTKRASMALRDKRKNVALTHLKSRKQLEDLLGKRLGSLETLEATLIRVEAAAGDVEIMKAYEQSTATLRTILAHPSLQRGHIDETMDALAEATADARDVDDAIRVGGDVALGVGVGGEGAAVDEGELEEELRALVEEQEIEARHREEEERLAKMQNKVQEEEAAPAEEKNVRQQEKERVPVAA